MAIKKIPLPLVAISPIDGRYWEKSEKLSNYFSEYALINTRVEIEIEYLIFLSEIKVAPKINNKRALRKIYKKFSLKDAEKVKEIEKETKHDVKAVEYFIREKIDLLSKKNLKPFVHYALTSNDINDNAYRIMIKRGLKNEILPVLIKVLKKLQNMSKRYADIPMLARTHGQAAVTTTFGKEMSVFATRLLKQINAIKSANLEGKLAGAVGNWNAHYFSHPEINWINKSKLFLKNFSLTQNTSATQTAPYEDLLNLFQHFYLANLIVYDLDQDMWRYISDGWLIKKAKAKEIGSSTMPQKINPVNFENSEGNIEIANGLFETMTRNLAISRLQRDLSDSTVMRNIGTTFAHCLIAYKNTLKGLESIKVDSKKMKIDLYKNWNILAEALQTILRKEGQQDAYESVAKLFKKNKINKKQWQEIVKDQNLSRSSKNKLLNLEPGNYLGIAEKLAKIS